jgi:signal transduction histidine kinase
MPQNREVMTELVVMHARIIRFLPLLDALILSAAVYDLHFFVPRRTLALWFCITMIMEGLRGTYSAIIFRRRKTIDPYLAHKWFVVLAGFSGLSLGLLAIVAFKYVPPMQITFMAAILFGYAAGGIGVAASPAIETTWSLSILLPAGYAYGALTPEQATAVWLLLLCFSGFLVFVANAAKNLLVQSIIIRHERDALVMDLERKNSQVREALTKVEQSAESRARVLAAASHDLRQPLHALSIYSAVLAANPAPETLQEVGHSVDKIVRSLGNLLNGLLDLSRLSVGYYVPDKRSFSLDKAVHDVCAEYQGPSTKKELTFVLDLQPTRIHSDPLAVSRIARNLLDNAVKYTELGQIRVETRVEGLRALLCVTDTGKGIPLSEQKRVFEEFYQIDNPGRDRGRGVGLGLAIVQRLCELIGADISLDSEPGRGSSFVVSFPDLVEEPGYVAEAKEPAKQAVLNGKRVYVVDDERDILNSMGTLLRVWGMVVSTAGSAQAAESLFIQDGLPNLLLVDLRLGEAEHGALFARRMQMVYGDFPVLVMTGETSSDALRQANEQAYPLLQKPIAQEMLRSAINNLLK